MKICYLCSIGNHLSQYQLLLYERTSKLFADFFDHQLSQATLVKANEGCYEDLKSVEEEIKKQIIASPVAHFDETGIRINEKGEWLHVASTETLTYYAAHPNRGQEATNDQDILSRFQGTAVHDVWKSYFKYDLRPRSLQCPPPA